MDKSNPVNSTDEETLPLFRWVGGKRKLLSKILPFVPKEYGTYYEPFFGGGALYFSLRPKQAVVGDVNADIVNLLQVVKDNPEELIQSLATNTNSKTAYYAMRAKNPTGTIQRATRFQYLVSLAFSGIYRVNKSGRFNVPYSHEQYREFFDANRIRTASKLLQNTTIVCGDFSETVKMAKAGDMVYFDPPYTVAHDNNGFLEYNECIFQWQDQVKLATLVKALAAKGVKVIVSNANHESVRDLYDKNYVHMIERKSTISAATGSRGDVKEILVVYP